MQITTTLIDQLISEGITSDTHHATIKKVAGDITGSKISSSDYKEIREALQNPTEEANVPTATAEPKAKKAKAKKTTKKAAKKAAPKAKAEKKEKQVAEPLSDKQRAKKAKEIIAERGDDPDMQGWENVVKATETNERGVPLRVEIRCSDTQEGAECAKTREIAAQDVFQVKRCIPCQKRYTQNYRNELARRRRAEANKEQQDG